MKFFEYRLRWWGVEKKEGGGDDRVTLELVSQKLLVVCCSEKVSKV